MTVRQEGATTVKPSSQQEIAQLCLRVAQSLELAHDRQSARWFTDAAASLRGASADRVADVVAQIHRTVRGGAAGPRGTVIVAADGRADSVATERLHADLERLYSLTRQSRLLDWIRSFTG